MKFLLLVSTWLIFAAIASAQNCPNGQCSAPRVTVIYQNAPTPQAQRYATLQSPPVCSGGTCQAYTVQPVTVYYRSAPRQFATPVRSGFCRLFGCR